MSDKKNKQQDIEKDEKTQELEFKYLRALADYQNLLKQSANEKQEFAKYANENLLRDFIPVYDYLKLSLEHAPSDDKWLEGVKHVLGQFKRVLSEAGVEEITAADQLFDHASMGAIETEDTDEEEKDGLVAKALKAGYSLNGKVIIPARVAVYRFKN